MSVILKPATLLLLLFNFISPSFIAPRSPLSKVQSPAFIAAPKIQAAILLDVSNSMDGLIEQAKAQLWNMVGVMGRAKCKGAAPQIEIALYEYGSPRNAAKDGFVKQLSGFTTDLDGLSKTLFGLTTNGGDEFCGQAIYTAIKDLAWDTAEGSYKVIFIAGNEDFLQGSVHYTLACGEAKKKGVVVNTLYCGDRQQGIREHWNLGSECGDGSFTNINQDAKGEDIPTPYDSTLMVLNNTLNGTYMIYGATGFAAISRQAEVDKMNMAYSRPAAIKRIAVKGNKNLYKNSTWDMVDASAADTAFVTKLSANDLPDSLKKLSKTALQNLVKAKQKERAGVQQQIAELSIKREAYLAAERKKRAANNAPTLETETERLIKEQAKRYRMVIN